MGKKVRRVKHDDYCDTWIACAPCNCSAREQKNTDESQDSCDIKKENEKTAE